MNHKKGLFKGAGFLLVSVFFCTLKIESVLASVKILTFKTHSRIEIAAGDSIEHQLEKSKSGFVLTLKSLNLRNLGDVSSLKDDKISRLQFTQKDEGVQISGDWKFPPKGSYEMETFIYQDQNPPRIFFDFWTKNLGSELKQKNEQSLLQQKKLTSQSFERNQKRLKEATQFCSKPLNDNSDIFVNHFAYHEKVDLSQWFDRSQSPEDYYLFYEPKDSDAKEGQYASLAHKLFKKSDYALAIKTAEAFEKEFPDSKFKGDLEFLKASSLYKLGHEDLALNAFEKIKNAQSNSTSAFATSVFLGKKYFDKEDWVKSLESFSWLSHRFPKHELLWVFKLAMAESLFQLKQYDRSVQEYREAAEKAPHASGKYEAIVREGDCYLNRQQYDKALSSYYRAIELESIAAASNPKFKALASPSINLGESYYGLKQLDPSKVAFQRAYSLYSGNSNSWRTTLRLGEILGRKKDPLSQKESREFFYKTINQYPTTPGATIARMRLIPCGDHGGFNAISARGFFEGEAKNLLKREDYLRQIDLKAYKALYSQLSLRSYLSLEDKVSALDAAIRASDQPDHPELSRSLSSVQKNFFAKQITEYLDQNKKVEALEFYQKRISELNLVPKYQYGQELSEEEYDLDVRYMLRLSRAASDLGLGSLALQIVEKYNKIYQSIELSAQSNGRRIASLKKIEPLSSERAYTEAKANWILHQSSEEKKIRNLLTQVKEGSEWVFAKEVLLGLLDERENRMQDLILHASRAQKILPELSKPKSVSYRLQYWIAQAQAKSGQTESSVRTFQNLLKSSEVQKVFENNTRDELSDLGLAYPADRESLLFSVTEGLALLAKWQEVVKTFEWAVSQGLSSNRIYYEYAQALIKIEASQDEVDQMLSKAASGTKEDFWKNLARRSLASQNAKEGKL